jgi:hypothetical protein
VQYPPSYFIPGHTMCLFCLSTRRTTCWVLEHWDILCVLVILWHYCLKALNIIGVAIYHGVSFSALTRFYKMMSHFVFIRKADVCYNLCILLYLMFLFSLLSSPLLSCGLSTWVDAYFVSWLDVFFGSHFFFFGVW